MLGIKKTRRRFVECLQRVERHDLDDLDALERLKSLGERLLGQKKPR